MADGSQGSPLKRRVPGATGASPEATVPRVLPHALIARMRAAVDAAHAAQGPEAAAAEPVTEPMPTLRAAVAAQDWPATGSPNGTGQRGDAWTFRLGAGSEGPPSGGLSEFADAALDDAAESYLAADPDLTSGYADDAALDDTARAITTSGWDALLRDTEPGTDVGHERAAWWDHAVRSGRPGEPDGAALGTPAGARVSRVKAGVAALAVVLVAGGVLTLALATRDHAGQPKLAHPSKSDAARIKAAARLASDIASAASWVAAQVSHASKVACDPVTCQALADHGIPDQRLEELGRAAADPFRAKVLVDTPALRRQFGTSVASWAPTVLAGYGAGTDQITVRLLAPGGAHAYLAALGADRKQRQVVGASLLTSSQITTTAAARSELASGDVDDRLLLAITALAWQHPIDIVAFGRTWPGTSAGVPMRTAYLAETDPAAYLTQTVYVQAMIGLLRAQPPAYRPVNIGLVRLDGRKVLSIWYPAPSPLGLVSPSP